MSTVTAPAIDTLSGLVAWLHPKSSISWSLADVLPDGPDRRRARVVAKFGLKTGQLVRLEGEWRDDPKWGRQFVASGLAVTTVNASGLRLWLERQVPGCGPARADLALKLYGDDLFDALTERTAETAAAVGLNPHLLSLAVQSLLANKAGADAAGRLRERGCPASLAVKIVDTLGAPIADAALADPYCLIGRVERVGWKTADELAQVFGVPRDAPCRLAAAVDFACQNLSEGEGHTAYGEGDLFLAVGTALELDADHVKAAVALSPRVEEREPGLYVHTRYGRAEREIELALAHNPRVLDSPAVERLAQQFAVLPSGSRLEGRQLEAFKAAMYSRVVVISGGAGVGKSSIARCVADALAALGAAPLLAAPTGKAAVRIAQLTDRPASTLHRLLGLAPGMEERRGLEPPPASFAGAVLCDESSMICSWLMSKLVTTISPDCRLVLIGDPNQLPSVGPGAVLRDLINADAVPHVHLSHCHRQSGLLKHNCFSVLSGGRPELFEASPRADWPTAPWIFHQQSTATAIRDSLAGLFAGGCRDKLAIEPYDLLVITPTNKGQLGTWALNLLIQAAYQKAAHGRAVSYPADAKRYQFHPGDRVVWTRNNYSLNLMNGELGRVVESAGEWARVRFDIRGEVEVEKKQMDDLSLAWAMTCHKCQGSQSRKTVVLAAREHADSYGLRNIVNRSWFYTAVTRSQEATVVLGDRDAVRQIIAREQRDDRVTTLFRGRG